MIKKIVALAALSLCGSAAYADNKVGLFFIPSADIELSAGDISGDDDGDGFGAYGRFDVSPTTFINVEYTAVEYDDSELEIDQIRAGFGGNIALTNPQLAVMLLGEIVNVDLGGEDETGFGLHAGLNFAATPQLDIYGQIGYLDVDEADGPEFKVGVDFQINSQFSVFGDYRATRFDNNGADLDLDDIRLGGAIHF